MYLKEKKKKKPKLKGSLSLKRNHLGKCFPRVSTHKLIEFGAGAGQGYLHLEVVAKLAAASMQCWFWRHEGWNIEVVMGSN